MAAEKSARPLRLTHFPTDGSAEWLKPKDLALACGALSCFPEANRVVVEVGVWKGAWSLGVLENVVGSEVIGVDPYPGSRGPEARAALERRAIALGVADRFRLAASYADAEAMLRDSHLPGVVHVDGEHTERAAADDLDWAATVLVPGGIMILDDHRNPWFPGIPSAMHAFLRARDFRMVLTTENKAYLCRNEDHAAWHDRLQKLLGDGSEVNWCHHHGDQAGGISYIQRPDVLERPVLLAIGRADVLPPDQRSASRRVMRAIVREVLPPALVRVARAGLRALRTRR